MLVLEQPVFQPFFKIDLKLRMDLAPVLTVACPLLCYVYGCQIQHFQQTVIGWKYGLGFCHLPQLAVNPLNGIGRVDQMSDCFRILEIRGQDCPVFRP